MRGARSAGAHIFHGLVAGWRRLKFTFWGWKLRVLLRRHGIRLELEGGPDVELGGLPRVLCLGSASGTLVSIRIGRGVKIRKGVRIHLDLGANNVLDLSDGVELHEDVRLWLLGGTIAIGAGTVIRDQALLKSAGRLTISEIVRVGYATTIHCHEEVEVGAHAVIADHCVLVDSDHAHDGSDQWVMDQPVRSAPIRIGSNALVTAHCVLTRGASIGANSVVAAGAVVRSGEYPAGSLIGGIPARQLKRL